MEVPNANLLELSADKGGAVTRFIDGMLYFFIRATLMHDTGDLVLLESGSIVMHLIGEDCLMYSKR